MRRQQGRRFAWTLALGFAAIGIVAVWRHRHPLTELLTAIAVAAFLAGIFVPTHLGPVERAWLAFGHALSRITTPVFLGVVYFGIVTPMGWVRRRIGRDPIQRDAEASSYWVERPRITAEQVRESFEHLY
ncbi:MAG TPA: SxtJ family membrane protein [Gemmatimonadaceae bacterium]|jgi:4-amino-4-deoxy-L-arabinose transferase-like glycosyltransferase